MQSITLRVVIWVKTCTFTFVIVYFQSSECSLGWNAAQNSGSLKLKYIWPHACHRHNLRYLWGMVLPAAASLLTQSLSLFINNGWNNERNLGKALLTAWSCCQIV